MIKPLGDSGLAVIFEETISLEVLKQVNSLKYYLEAESFDGILELVASYNSLLIYYDPMAVLYADVKDHVEVLLKKPLIEDQERKVVEIPVLYDGPDLQRVADHTGLTFDEIIDLHTEATYTVYMLGFSPGFPYLGGMNPKLRTPRRTSPRLKIEAGSVGIADMQTGVYSVASPGGWQIIGRTPLKLFDLNREMPTLLDAGDRLHFVAIDQSTYDLLEGTND